MTAIRRLLGLPRLSFRIYLLIFALLLVFAYIVTVPAHQFFAKFWSSMGSFYEPKDLEREEHLKIIEEKER